MNETGHVSTIEVLAQMIKPALAHEKECHVGMHLRDSVDSSVGNFQVMVAPSDATLLQLVGFRKTTDVVRQCVGMRQRQPLLVVH